MILHRILFCCSYYAKRQFTFGKQGCSIAGRLKVHADAAQGRFCARRPGLVLAAAAAAAALCALGLIRLRVETDPQRLWVGAGSQAAREKADYEVPRPCWAGTVID